MRIRPMCLYLALVALPLSCGNGTDHGNADNGQLPDARAVGDASRTSDGAASSDGGGGVPDGAGGHDSGGNDSGGHDSGIDDGGSHDSGSGTNIYLGQTGAGMADGTDCANAYAYSFFNDSGNWGSSASQIGPGATVHLCGAFTLPAGASGTLTFQGSGNASGSITVRFEAGAVASAPYWGPNGFLFANGKDYLVVDGGTNGTIEATANGALLANNVGNGTGIYFSGVSSSVIENLTIANLYVAVQNNTNNESTNAATSGIRWDNGSNIAIKKNVIHDVFYGVYHPYASGNQNIEISSNIISNVSTGIVVGSGNSNATLSGTNVIHDNDISNMAPWDRADDANHHDGIHVWATQSGTSIAGLEEYNNYFHGTLGLNTTAWLYNECSSACTVPGITVNIFNNVLYNQDPESDISTGAGGNGLSECSGSTCNYYNNTFVSLANYSDINNAIHFELGSLLTIENNVFFNTFGAVASGGGTITASDYNDVNGTSTYVQGTGCGSTCSLSAWKAFSGKDTHSVTGNPLLNSGSAPPWELTNATSAAWLTGVNLSSLNIAALARNRAGVVRPSSGPWDIGAY